MFGPSKSDQGAEPMTEVDATSFCANTIFWLYLQEDKCHINKKSEDTSED
jgi:hypothetical protein